MAKIKKDCPYILDMDGVPICRLNILPCGRVHQGLCEFMLEEDRKVNKRGKYERKTKG